MVAAVLWFIIMFPLMLGCGVASPLLTTEAKHRKAEATHRKQKARYTPPRSPNYSTVLRNQACSLVFCLLNACWHRLQDCVFGMRTRRFKQRPGRRARRSTTYYVGHSHKRGARVCRKHNKWARLICFATLFQAPVASTARTAFSSGLSKQFPIRRQFAAFDSDSVALRVDNCCTASITNSLADVVGEPISIRARIEGFTGGKALVKARCTIKWRVEDDDGRIHNVLLPNSLYSQAAPFRLLSPQHWAQQAKDHHPKREGTWCGTLSDRVELEWGQRKFKRTVLLDPATNVALFHTAPSYEKYEAYCTVIDNPNDEVAPPPVAFEVAPSYF
jgi:hypothetical protein